MVSYVASKHAVIGLTKSAALDYAKDNIRVSALSPGITWTPMMERGFVGIDMTPEQCTDFTPLKRLGKAEEQADAVVWLCSQRSSFVTGISVIVDGGACI